MVPSGRAVPGACRSGAAWRPFAGARLSRNHATRQARGPRSRGRRQSRFSTNWGGTPLRKSRHEATPAPRHPCPYAQHPPEGQRGRFGNRLSRDGLVAVDLLRAERAGTAAAPVVMAQDVLHGRGAENRVRIGQQRPRSRGGIEVGARLVVMNGDAERVHQFVCNVMSDSPLQVGHRLR